jgi:hypothetical protein
MMRGLVLENRAPGNDVSDITSRHVPGSQMRDVTESLMMLCEQTRAGLRQQFA